MFKLFLNKDRVSLLHSGCVPIVKILICQKDNNENNNTAIIILFFAKW